MADSAPAPAPAKVKKTKKAAAPTHPKTLDMVVEAIKALKDSKGSSVQAIKGYILANYPTVSPSHLTSSLRRALKSGCDSGKLVRPKGSTAKGVTGRLRVGKEAEKPKKKPAKKAAPKKKPAKKPVKKAAKKPAKKVAKKADKKKTPKKAVKAKKPKKTPTKKAATKKTPKKAAKPKKPKAKKVAKK
ncbi:sperm-specific protein PHI-2B/PHI-3-like [Glandiceps talaboti]